MTTETTAMLLTAGVAIIVVALFVADWLFYKPVCMHDIPHTPKPPLPKPQPLKRLPPLVRRAVSIPYSYGGVDVGLLLYYWGTDHLLIIGKINSGDADDNKRRADELVDAINSIIKQQITQDNEPQHPF